MTLAQPPSQRTPLLATAISVLAGPVLWFIHFNAAYAIVDFGCRIGSEASSLVTLILIVTAAVLIPLALAGLFAFHRWRHHNRMVEPKGDQDARDVYERRRFIAFLGVVLSVVFTIGILVTVAPVFFVSVCQGIVM